PDSADDGWYRTCVVLPRHEGRVYAHAVYVLLAKVQPQTAPRRARRHHETKRSTMNPLTSRFPIFALYTESLRRARPHWRQLGVVLLMGMLAAPIALLTPLPLQIVVDHVLAAQQPSGLV